MTSSPSDTIAALESTCARHEIAAATGRVVWRCWGRGDPLVLLHGGTGSWLHWARNIEALAADFTLLVPDVPGYGDSDMPPVPITPDALAAALAEGIDHFLGASRFTIGGFSLGGMLAAHTAAICAPRVRRVLLAGPVGFTATLDDAPALASWRSLPSDQQAEVQRRNLGILMLHDPAKVDDLAVLIQARNAARARMRRTKLSPVGGVLDRLSRAGAPVSSIWGEHDPLAAGALDERRDGIARAAPGATFDVIPGAGHWVQYEAAEAFNRLFRARASARAASA